MDENEMTLAADMTGLEPVGNYAVQPIFSDGHDSGIYSWEYLYFLGSQQEQLWADYNAQLAAADKFGHALLHIREITRRTLGPV